ncbi:MAG: thioesterase domain-containing protein [Bacteroidota bacterium]
MNLFCFPYAGGSGAVFNSWKPHLDKNITLYPVEMAGRGKRINEEPYHNIEEAVDDIFESISSELQQAPFMFFGHSLGALISYELALKLRKLHFPQPLHLFFSGKGAPHIDSEDEKKYHLMKDDEFRTEVLRLGGTPPEFFDHPELLELFVPLLKNDFRIAENYFHKGDVVPFDQNITVFLGKHDNLTEEQCNKWKEFTNKGCNIHHFEGGHFFLHDHMMQIIEIINNTKGITENRLQNNWPG